MPENAKVTVYLPASLYERCVTLSDADHRSLSSWIVRQLSDKINEIDCAKHKSLGGITGYAVSEEKLHS